jgi:hypothetical protein
VNLESVGPVWDLLSPFHRPEFGLGPSKEETMRQLRPSVLRRLAPSAAALVVGMLFGSAAPASAQNDGVLHACVRVDRRGEFRGELRIVGANQRCARSEAPVMLPLVGAAPDASGSGDRAYEGGGIKGVLTECTVPTAGSMAYLNGHSFVVFIGADASNTVTGAFEMHQVPPGSYDVILEVPNLSPRIMQGVAVTSGQITDLGKVDVCFID